MKTIHVLMTIGFASMSAACAASGEDAERVQRVQQAVESCLAEAENMDNAGDKLDILRSGYESGVYSYAQYQQGQDNYQNALDGYLGCVHERNDKILAQDQ